MMKFLTLDKKNLEGFFDNIYKKDIDEILGYVVNNFPEKELDILKLPSYIYKKRYQAIKPQLLSVIVKLFDNPKFITTFYTLLSKNEASNYIYNRLIWTKGSVDTYDFIDKFGIELKPLPKSKYGLSRVCLEDELSLVHRDVSYAYNGDMNRDIIHLSTEVRDMLKMLYPIPNEYNLIAQNNPKDTEFTYSNEDEVLPFIRTISEMLENKLVEFGKTNEKPLVKSLNILKEATSLNEFYHDKKMDNFVVDMLTRTFYYYNDRFNSKEKELDSLKVFMQYQLKDDFRFTISRIFTSHLSGVRFGRYSNEQETLFGLLKEIVRDMPIEAWVSFENIKSYTHYRESYFRFEDEHKTRSYEFKSSRGSIYVGVNYNNLFHEPVLKALFFYLGALGLMELKYDRPASNCSIKAKGKPYISVWDGLKYVKLTELGKYILGRKRSYVQKEIVVKKAPDLKFDEFKPIVTVDKRNSIAIAKLDPFVEKLDGDRYILTHSKFFKDCKNIKDLELKIDNFYKKIEQNPPKVFGQFFDNMIKESNLMNRNLKQIVIELKDNKRLLNLFMSDRKLQELFIKAEGYRIIVLIEDIPKVTKIVKDNGFFVEF